MNFGESHNKMDQKCLQKTYTVQRNQKGKKQLYMRHTPIFPAESSSYPQRARKREPRWAAHREGALPGSIPHARGAGHPVRPRRQPRSRQIPCRRQPVRNFKRRTEIPPNWGLTNWRNQRIRSNQQDTRHPGPRNRGTNPSRRVPHQRGTKPHATNDASQRANNAQRKRAAKDQPLQWTANWHQAQRQGTNRHWLHRRSRRNAPQTRGTSSSNEFAKHANAVPSGHNRRTKQNSEVCQQQPAVRINARTTGSRNYPAATGQPQPASTRGKDPKPRQATSRPPQRVATVPQEATRPLRQL